MTRPAIPAPRFDEGLIRKYDKAGPRYTSYPTAPHFHERFGPAEYEAQVRAAAATNQNDGVSLYFHLPFCRRVCYFCACNTIFTNDRESGRLYHERVAREMDLTLAFLGKAPLVRQLHWGGGTPTFSAPELLDELGRMIHERFPFADDAEVSVEVDPRETTARHLEVLRRHGFNRISLGVQDFDPDVQRAVNRIQPWEQTKATVDTARALGFTSVNIDLIYGLPRQSQKTFEETLDRVVELAPDRVALFNFAYLPEMVRHQRVLKPEQLPLPGEKLAILRRAIERLTQAGWVFIGMDHFARPDDELERALADGTLGRNFQGYTTRAGLDLYGFGVTAISRIGNSYSQNRKEMASWAAALEAGQPPTARGIVLTADDLLRREMIDSLMCHFAIDAAAVGKRHGFLFTDRFASELAALEPLADDGLVTIDSAGIRVLPPGRLLIRNIAMVFDAYLAQDSGPRYSRTV